MLTNPPNGYKVDQQQDFRKQIGAMKAGQMDEVLQKSQHPTVFQELITGSLPVAEKETRRLQDEAQLVVAAGVTTTGWALSVASYHIINNPAVFQKLRTELTTALPDPTAKLDWTELEKLPYLSGCVRESVRMSYAVTTRNPRLFAKPLAYQDWTIPPRTPVSMTIVDVCDDEAIFPDPRTFRPERWMGNPKTKDGQSLERYFVGFGKGTRSCLGIKSVLILFRYSCTVTSPFLSLPSPVAVSLSSLFPFPLDVGFPISKPHIG